MHIIFFWLNSNQIIYNIYLDFYNLNYLLQVAFYIVCVFVAQMRERERGTVYDKNYNFFLLKFFAEDFVNINLKK